MNQAASLLSRSRRECPGRDDGFLVGPDGPKGAVRFHGAINQAKAEGFDADAPSPLIHLLRINDELLQLCKFLNEKRDMATSSRLIPLVDDLTHILIEAGKNKLR
jgi:hypothetical protein